MIAIEFNNDYETIFFYCWSGEFMGIHSIFLFRNDLR